MRRVTYEEMAAFWPTSTSEYARPMNEIPEVVFSKTLQDADRPETRIARGDLSAEIAVHPQGRGTHPMSSSTTAPPLRPKNGRAQAGYSSLR
jgi:hypothetical protein